MPATCQGSPRLTEAHFERVDAVDALGAIGDVDGGVGLFMNTRMISPKPSVTMAR